MCMEADNLTSKRIVARLFLLHAFRLRGRAVGGFDTGQWRGRGVRVEELGYKERVTFRAVAQ